MADASKRPTIARIWRGRTLPERADEYEAYHSEAGLKHLSRRRSVFNRCAKIESTKPIRDDLLLGKHRGHVTVRRR